MEEQLFEYFKDTPDKDFVAIVDYLVYFREVDERIITLVTEFLVNNEVEDTYNKCRADILTPNEFFCRASLSDRQIFSEIGTALLSLSHLRLKRLL